MNDILLFGALAVIGAVLLVNLAHQHLLALDFHYWYWPAGHRVLLGQSPYQQPYPLGLNYPAPAALVFALWALLPPAVADAAFTVFALLSVGAVLALLRVRDGRIYGLVLIWPAIAYGWQTANLSLLLVAGIAAAWRWRDRPVVAGALIAGVVAMKPVFLPIVLWLLATRRYRSVAYAAVIAALLMLSSFAALGFDQLHAYITQTQVAVADVEHRGCGVFALVLKLGGDHVMGYLVIATLATLTAAACVWLGHHGRDRESLSLAIATMLIASPVVESHYLSLLIIPVALAKPRLSLLWLLPLCLWITPESQPSLWQLCLVLITYTALFVASLHALRGTGPTADSRRIRTARAVGVCRMLSSAYR